MKDVLWFCRVLECPLPPKTLKGLAAWAMQEAFLGPCPPLPTPFGSESAFELRYWALVLAWYGVSHSCTQPHTPLTPTCGLLAWPGHILSPSSWPCPALWVVSDPTHHPWTCWVQQLPQLLSGHYTELPASWKRHWKLTTQRRSSKTVASISELFQGSEVSHGMISLDVSEKR